MKNKKFFIVTGIVAVLLVGGYIMYQESKKAGDKAESPGSESSEDTSAGSSAAKIITNFDKTWDYKLENGIWYTKKKTESAWRNMKDVASDYNKAVSKLTAFINQ
jgi:hypothetical protein